MASAPSPRGRLAWPGARRVIPPLPPSIWCGELQGLTGLQELYIRASEESWRIVDTEGKLLEWHPIAHMERHGETALFCTGRLCAKQTWCF